MMAMLNKLKDKLERECNDHKQAKQQLAELSARLQQVGSVCSQHNDGIFIKELKPGSAFHTEIILLGAVYPYSYPNYFKIGLGI